MNCRMPTHCRKWKRHRTTDELPEVDELPEIEEDPALIEALGDPFLDDAESAE